MYCFFANGCKVRSLKFNIRVSNLNGKATNNEEDVMKKQILTEDRDFTFVLRRSNACKR